MHPPALAPHSASLFELCLNVVCTEAATWGRWPQIVQAHLFPQNVPQHGCEATAAAVDPLCKATVFQEHSWALFHVGIRSLLQIKDFLLCICGKKVRKFESPLFLAYFIWLGIQCIITLCVGWLSSWSSATSLGERASVPSCSQVFYAYLQSNFFRMRHVVTLEHVCQKQSYMVI